MEKVVKLWGVLPFPGDRSEFTSGIERTPESGRPHPGRRVYNREEYVRLSLEGGVFMSHDYSAESTEENPRMMAFFDSLIQREIEGDSSSSEGGQDDPDESSSSAARMVARRSPRTGGGGGGGGSGGGFISADEDPWEAPEECRRISHLIARRRQQLALRSTFYSAGGYSRVENPTHVARSLKRASKVIASDSSSGSSSSTSDEEASVVKRTDDYDSKAGFIGPRRPSSATEEAPMPEALLSGPPSDPSGRMEQEIRLALGGREGNGASAATAAAGQVCDTSDEAAEEDNNGQAASLTSTSRAVVSNGINGSSSAEVVAVAEGGRPPSARHVAEFKKSSRLKRAKRNSRKASEDSD